MSLESFFGLESDQPMSESAFEAFKEKMAAAAAQIAAIRKEESKQKKKEDELLKILLQFVKTSHKSQLVLLISRVLEQNIPAGFILAIILLGNEEIQQAVGTFLLLPGQVEAFENSSDKALIFFNAKDETLPLKIKIELDNWIKNIIVQAEENPQKLVRTGYDREMIEIEDENAFGEPKFEEKKEVKKVLIQLFTFAMRDFLENRGVDDGYEKLYDFGEFVLTGILKKTEENLEQRRFLGGEVSEPI